MVLGLLSLCRYSGNFLPLNLAPRHKPDTSDVTKKLNYIATLRPAVTVYIHCTEVIWRAGELAVGKLLGFSLDQDGHD